MSVPSTTKECFLSLGSNLGDRVSYLKRGILGLEKRGIVVRSVSSVYETEPVDMTVAGYFYNIVVKAETSLSPEDLLKACLLVEKSMGRTRIGKNESRVLDIDILFYSRSIIEKEKLRIPHARVHLRRFVLIPLQEIDANFVHPTFGKSIDDLLKECPDQSSVRKCSKEEVFPVGESRSQ